MCGIAGIIGGNRSTREPMARRMLASLARRGPDGEGLESWADGEPGHRRLAIIALTAAARQPMLTADGQIGLVFNGEIFNFRDLRDDLSARGYHFTSGTDSEVILH